MRKWLAVAVGSPLFVATAAHAQMKELAAPVVADVAKSHEIDLRLSQQQGIEHPLLLIQGMIAQQELAPNASVGVGLANMYGRKKGPAPRLGDPPTRSKKPAVSFVLKF
ncbi:MAG: hypothetical protein ACJ8EH_12980 [Sphingomicrobium sp.]|jgi:hypothetical protein